MNVRLEARGAADLPLPRGEGVGWVGYWEREWHGDQVYEIGCNSQFDLFSSGEG